MVFAEGPQTEADQGWSKSESVTWLGNTCFLRQYVVSRYSRSTLQALSAGCSARRGCQRISPVCRMTCSTAITKGVADLSSPDLIQRPKHRQSLVAVPVDDSRRECTIKSTVRDLACVTATGKLSCITIQRTHQRLFEILGQRICTPCTSLR